MTSNGEGPEVEFKWSEADSYIPADPDHDIPEQVGVYGAIRMAKNAGTYLRARFGVEVGKLMHPLSYAEDAEEHMQVEIDDALGVFRALHTYLMNVGRESDKYTYRIYRGLFESIGKATSINQHIPRMRDIREYTGRLFIDLAGDDPIEESQDNPE